MFQGFHFLYYLEKLVGKESWDKFIPHYFTTWYKKSLDSYEFKATLLDFFASDKAATKALESVDWDTWFYSPGLPPKPDFDTSMVDKSNALAKKWESKVSFLFPIIADQIANFFRTTNPPPPTSKD
jgi:leukotriene-A4 hydrolase